MSELSQRQQAILNRIIEAYIETAQPVGSRFITDLYTGLYHNAYSPATVRAEMGLMESMGYLTHPHTSAGRIPTDRGYRYYVDHTIEQDMPETFSPSLKAENFPTPAEESQSVWMEKISAVLSSLSEEVGIFVTAETLKDKIRYQVFWQGSTRMLEKPEFQDVQKARSVFQMLEEKEKLGQWLLERQADGPVAVTIGKENSSENFWQCAVVSSCCGGRGRLQAVVAILGPKRMHYTRTVPLVSRMGKFLKNILDDLDYGQYTAG